MKTLISTFLPFRLSFPSFPSSFPLFSCLVSPHFQSGFPSFPLGYFTFSCPPSNKPSNSQSALTPSLCLNPFGNHLRYHHRLFPIVPIHRRLPLLHRRLLSQPNPFPAVPLHRRLPFFVVFPRGLEHQLTSLAVLCSRPPTLRWGFGAQNAILWSFLLQAPREKGSAEGQPQG